MKRTVTTLYFMQFSPWLVVSFIANTPNSWDLTAGQHLPLYILILTETEISPSTVTRVQIWCSPKMKSRKTWSEIPRISTSELFSSTHEGVREATRYAIDVAKEAGCIVSFDPNLRPPLWKSLDDAKAEIEYGLANAIFWKSQITKLNSCSELQTMTKVPHFWKRNTTFRLSLSHLEKTEAALTTKTWKWRLILSFRKRLSRQQVQAIPSAQVP